MQMKLCFKTLVCFAGAQMAKGNLEAPFVSILSAT